MAAPKKLLMIDDDRILLDMFKVVCEAKGYEFHSAASGAEGMKRILEVGPDAIILDVMMEDFVAGYRVLSELRTPGPGSEFAKHSRVPIILLTGVASKTSASLRDHVGTALLPVDAYLEKPVEPLEMLAVLDRVLAAGEPGAAASSPEG